MTGGIGRAIRLGDGVLGYAMVDMSLRSRGKPFAISPGAGLIAKGSERWNAWLQTGYNYTPTDGRGNVVYRFEGRYSVAVNRDIRLTYEDGDEGKLLLSFQFHI